MILISPKFAPRRPEAGRALATVLPLPSAGSLTAAGYNISNLYLKADSMYNGLFGNVGKGGLVHNVTIASGELTASKACLGGVAGYLQDGTVDNCVNYATIRSTVESTTAPTLTAAVSWVRCTI